MLIRSLFILMLLLCQDALVAAPSPLDLLRENPRLLDSMDQNRPSQPSLTQNRGTIENPSTFKRMENIQKPLLSPIESIYNKSFETEGLPTKSIETELNILSDFENQTYLEPMDSPAFPIKKTPKPTKEVYKKKTKPSEQPDFEHDLTHIPHESPILQFGYDIFTNKNSLSSEYHNIPVSNSYILGPGDTLLIRVWGKIDVTFSANIDNSGNIFIPKIGQVHIGGETFKNAKRTIRDALEKHYVNFELSIVVENVRTIKVFVLGQVTRPGAYNISSLSTLISALYTSGGPIKNGTLRHIKLIRNKKVIKTIDLYKYLLNGDKYQDPNLKDLDTVLVGPIGDVVCIKGAVKREGIYELSSKTKAWDALMQFSGGLAPNAYSQHILIKRYFNGLERQITDIHAQSKSLFKKKLQQTHVENGDMILISKIDQTEVNGIQIFGAINYPGLYGLTPNLTLQSLINRAGGLQKGANLSKVDIYRHVGLTNKEILKIDLNKPNYGTFKLQAKDIINIYSQDSFIPPQYVYINGAVNKPGKYRWVSGLTPKDLLLWAGLEPFSELDNVDIVTHSNGDRLVRNISLNADHETINQVTLEPNDEVFIRYKANYFSKKTISLSGEIRFPGDYAVQENESLQDIIRRAGGLTNEAFLKGAIFTRKESARRQYEVQEKILKEEKHRLFYASYMLDHNIQKLDKTAYSDNEDDSAQLETIRESTETENKGRIIIELETILNDPTITLKIEDGDTLYIPPTPTAIHIVGGVQNATSVLFEPDKDINYYIKKAGGYSEFADTNRTYIIKTNGAYLKAPALIHRGDSIYVSETKLIPVDWLDVITKTTQTIFNITASLKALDII